MKPSSDFRVLGISSSMRSRSFSHIALRVALEYASDAGAQTHLLNLRESKIPTYAPDIDNYNSTELNFASSEVEWADAFILASPDYHGSMAGSLKNFLDHYWHEFSGKLFGYVVASHEKGLTVMDHMRTSVRQCYGWSLPYGVSVHSEQDFNAGEITNPKLLARLNMLARDLTVYGKILRNQFRADIESSDQFTFAAKFR